MAVRDAILVLLTAGPAYGFQVHGELALRTGGRREVNVGQTYATLDRLTGRKLIEPAGATDDGLPLHRLTEAGRRTADAWLSGADSSGADAWDETVDRVLLATSLPDVDASPILAAESDRWRGRRDDAVLRSTATDAEPAESPASGVARAAARAEADRAVAVLTWLERMREHPPVPFEPSAERPKRGRRPGHASRPADPSAETGASQAAIQPASA